MLADASRFARAAADCASTSTEALECAEKLLGALEVFFSIRVIFKGDVKCQREGISLLEVKNHDFLAYMAEMAFLMERMSVGGSIQKGNAVERTTRYRTILERIKPIETKLKPQIDRLMLSAESSAQTAKKRLRARPDLMEFDKNAQNDDKEAEEDDEQEEETRKSRKYVPPKIMAVHYDGDAETEKRAKRMEKNKRRALQSTLIQELKQQYSEAPLEEIMEDGRSLRVRQMDKERQEHEETFLMRTRLDKKEIKRRRREANTSAIDKLLEFGDYMAADDTLRQQVLSHKDKKKGRKRKMSAKRLPGKKKKINKHRRT